MKCVIDRFEGKFAVCEKENGDFIAIEITDIPNNAKEGDVLVFYENSWHVHEGEKNKIKREIDELIEELFE